jgi:DNA modification methylase
VATSLSLFEDSVSNYHANRLFDEDRAAHNWYRFVLSYPAHLVREYLCRWDICPHSQVLDPFCGTGTTLVEAKKLGFKSIGVEANPVVQFAASTKIDWSPDALGLLIHAEKIAKMALKKIDSVELLVFDEDEKKLLLKDSINPVPLHKILALKQMIEVLKENEFYAHELLALAKVAVGTASNLRFGPEVGVSTKKKMDAPVIEEWIGAIREIVSDLAILKKKSSIYSKIYLGDARYVGDLIEKESVDAVFTSPPYPNEKDYSRTTRLEMVLLGYASTKDGLREIKKNLLRSNTRNVYKGDTDDIWVEGFSRINEIADEIERRRVQMGKTSGFEKLYPKVTKLYFGGMARHLAEMRLVLRPGARLGYVVGDQASYLRVMINTGEILGEIAESLGYEKVGIDLFRTRLSTATKEMMREEVLLLRWPG